MKIKLHLIYQLYSIGLLVMLDINHQSGCINTQIIQRQWRFFLLLILVATCMSCGLKTPLKLPPQATSQLISAPTQYAIHFNTTE